MNYIKVGRIYWIRPVPVPGYKSKPRPAIALNKYGEGKTVFIQLGTSNSGEPASVKCTNLLRESLDDKTFRPERETGETNIWLDPSKPEWNTSILKPHIKNNKFIDVEHKTLEKIRRVYHNRKKQLENTRIKRAKGFILFGKIKNAEKQLEMLIAMDPIKHKNLDVQKFIKDFSDKNK